MTSGGFGGGPGGLGGGPGGGRAGPGGTNVVTNWVTTNCGLVEEAKWNKPTTSTAAATNVSGMANGIADGARAFPGGPTAGQFTLYDCKGKG